MSLGHDTSCLLAVSTSPSFLPSAGGGYLIHLCRALCIAGRLRCRRRHISPSRLRRHPLPVRHHRRRRPPSPERCQIFSTLPPSAPPACVTIHPSSPSPVKRPSTPPNNGQDENKTYSTIAWWHSFCHGDCQTAGDRELGLQTRLLVSSSARLPLWGLRADL